MIVFSELKVGIITLINLSFFFNLFISSIINIKFKPTNYSDIFFKYNTKNHILDFILSLIFDKQCQNNPDAIKNSIVSEILKVGYLIPKVIQDKSVNA